MNNKQRLFLLKASAQVNPMSPAVSGGFELGGQNLKLDKGPESQLGTPQQLLAGLGAGGNMASKPPMPGATGGAQVGAGVGIGLGGKPEATAQLPAPVGMSAQLPAQLPAAKP
jgi:hypothetical protein